MMEWLKTGIALFALLATSPGIAQISPNDFTEKFIQRLEQSNPDVTTETSEPLALTAANPDGKEVVVFLSNAYELYVQDTDQLDDLLGRYVASLVETLAADDAPPLSLSDIVPVVKESTWLTEAIGAAFADRDEDPPEYYQVAFVEGLSIIYAEDTPANIRYIERAAIEDVGIDTGSILTTAIDNLLTKLPDITVEGGDGLYMVIADGTYEASLMLVDEIWNSENFDVSGNIVVALPSRDVLLVSGTQNDEQLEQLQAIARQVYSDSPYNLTPNLYVRRNSRWEVFNAPSSME